MSWDERGRPRPHSGDERGGGRGQAGKQPPESILAGLRRRQHPPRGTDAEPLAAILESLGEDGSLAAGMALGRLGRRWSDVVGERLAAECRPVGLRQGTLSVRVSSGAWAAQVQFLAGDVVRLANEVLGEEAVSAVAVTVDPGATG